MGRGKFALISMAVAVLLAFSGLAKAAAYKVYVEPVEVFNADEVKELSPGLRSMMASRISGKGYVVATDESSKKGSLFSLRTTITRLSGVYSLDAELRSSDVSVDGGRVYETVSNIEDLMKAMETVAEYIKTRLTQVEVESLQTQAAPAPQQQEAPVAPQVVQPVQTAPQPQAAPAPQQKTISEILSGYKKVGSFKGEATGIASADIDHDGNMEIVLLVERKFVIFRETAGGAEKIWEGSTGLGYLPQTVSVADIDGDKIPEIFVAGISGSDTYTQAFNWIGGKPVEKGGRINALVRVFPHADLGFRLAGMASSGGPEALYSRLREYTWNGEDFKAGERIPLPSLVKTANLQWGRFDDGKLLLMLLDSDRKLRLYDDTMDKLIVSDDSVMGARTRIEGERDQRTFEPGTQWELNPPAILWKAPDGHIYALMHKNEDSALSPNSWGLFTSGEITALRWDGMALHQGGESPKFPGFIGGIAKGAGDTKIYATFVKSEGLILKDYETNLLVFNLQ